MIYITVLDDCFDRFLSVFVDFVCLLLNEVRLLVELNQISNLHCFILLSQPNNNHSPNNKTTISVVGLRLSNRWEYHPPTHPHPPTTQTQNYMIEQK